MCGCSVPFTCDEHGGQSRRSFLKRSSAASLAIGVPASFLGIGAASAADQVVKATHGGGFCNLGIFLTHAEQLAQKDGVEVEFVVTPTQADQVNLFGAGQVDLSVVPYTNFLTLYDAGAPVTVVAGGGVEGCVIVSRPGLDTAAKLKGKTLGTFQADTLEILPYDWLKKNGVGFNEVNVRYLGGTPEIIEAFVAGSLDWICVIEPYGQAALDRVPGAHKLSDGRDVYGKWYPDCLLAARNGLMESNPKLVKTVIKAMMAAQYRAESDREAVLQELVGTYYKTSIESARIAAEKQPVMVDMRHATDFIVGRGASLLEIGYIKAAPKREAIDWRLLEEVIAENQDLYAKLKIKPANI